MAIGIEQLTLVRVNIDIDIDINLFEKAERGRCRHLASTRDQQDRIFCFIL